MRGFFRIPGHIGGIFGRDPKIFGNYRGLSKVLAHYRGIPGLFFGGILEGFLAVSRGLFRILRTFDGYLDISRILVPFKGFRDP